MEKLLVNGVEIEFNDLSSEAQKKLYLQNKAKFQKEAAKSKYAEIRRILVKDEECEESTLEELFEIETKIYGDITNIQLIWNSSKFKKTDEKRKELSESDSTEIRKILAKDKESSSKLLNEMLRNEVQNKKYLYEYVVDAIFDNPKFQMEEETLRVLAESRNFGDRLNAIKCEDASSKFLNEMLRNEVQNEQYQNPDIVDYILDNSKFQMEQETLKVLVEKKEYRRKAARSESNTSEFLNQILRDEVQNEGHQDERFKEDILDNPKFQMEEETLKVLAKSGKWRDRRRAAKCECEYVSSEFLNDMLRNELNGDIDDDVISTILENSKFQMDDKTRRELAKSNSSDYRQMVIGDAGTSKELLEEMCLNETNEKLLKMIEEELFSRISKKTVTLDMIQKKKIYEILKELKNSKKRQPLSNYLEKILEIIA